MLNRIRIVVLASLSIVTIGLVVGADHHTRNSSSQTSVAEQVDFRPSGVFGWD